MDLDHDTKTRLWRLSNRTGKSEDDLVREAIANFLDNHEVSTSTDDKAVELNAQNMLLRGEFEQGYHLNAIRAFLLFRKHGRTPPDWALKHLEDSFIAYSRNRVANSLDKLLGMAPLGQGKEGADETEKRKARNHWVITNICVGRHLIDPDTGNRYPLEVVCEHVARHLEKKCAEKDWEPLTAGAIKSLWKKHRGATWCEQLMSLAEAHGGFDVLTNPYLKLSDP